VSLGAEPVDDADTQWYHCDCELGYLRVGVIVGTSMRQNMIGPLRVMRQAALLGEVELTVQAIELWQQIELDLQPLEDVLTDAVPIEPAATLELSMAPKINPDARDVRVLFPMDTLRRLKPVDAALSESFSMQWQQLDAELVVEDLTLSDEERKTIEQGGLVLLPHSFEEQWHANIRFLGDINAQIAGTFNIGSAEMTLSGSLQPLDTDSPLRLRLKKRISVEPDTLLGDVCDSTLALELPHSNIEAELFQGAETLATGALGPLGAGHAFYIDQLVSDTSKTTVQA